MPDIVDAIYAAVLDECAWRSVMEQIVGATGGSGGALAVQDLRTHRLRSAVWVGDAAMLLARSYDERVATRSALWDRTASAPVGSVFTDRVLLPGPGARRHRREVTQPAWIGSAMAAIVLRDGSLSGTATVLRAIDRPDFDEAEQQLMRRVAPHLARAMQVRQQLAAAALERAAARLALDRVDCAVFVVDRRGTAAAANCAAERILGRGDGLRLERGALRCDDRADAVALDAALKRTIAGEGYGASLAISRRSGSRPFSAVVAPLHGPPSAIVDGEAPAAILVATDPERAEAASAELLQHLYGLTPAEARTAVSLVEADGAKMVAERLGVTAATIRTHLHRVFDKTGTRRQSELVRLVLAHGRVRPPG